MWVTAHKILKLYLSIYRDDGWRTTKLKTWDMLKWNAVGDHVYITKRAISEFLSNPVVEKQTKASEYNEAAPKGARCFVAEHMFPTYFSIKSRLISPISLGSILRYDSILYYPQKSIFDYMFYRY